MIGLGLTIFLAANLLAATITVAVGDGEVGAAIWMSVLSFLLAHAVTEGWADR